MADAIATADSTRSGEAGWTGLRIAVVGLCFALNMLDGADLLVMSFVAPVLSQEWGITPESLGIIFSASLAGMAGGCLFLAPLSDRFGRRPTLLGALALVTISMIASSQVGSVSGMVIARFFVGLGVGTIGVTMTAIAAEFAPPRASSFAVGFVQAGWPFGSILTAFATVTAMPHFGWHGVLLGVGVLSAVLFVIISIAMPESGDYLMRSQPAGALDKINRLRGRLGDPLLDVLPAKHAKGQRIRLFDLFADGRGKSGVLLWTAVALGYFVLYFAISWIPKLATMAGLPLDQAIYAGATYNLGAFLGTTFMGWLALRFDLPKVIAVFFFAAAVALIVFGNVSLPLMLTLLAALCVGIAVQGGFNGFWALAARFYPVEIRGTGIGWALGVGRIGAVLGPIVGGFLVGANFSVGAIFAIFAVPAVLAGLVCLTIALPREQAA